MSSISSGAYNVCSKTTCYNVQSPSNHRWTRLNRTNGNCKRIGMARGEIHEVYTLFWRSSHFIVEFSLCQNGRGSYYTYDRGLCHWFISIGNVLSMTSRQASLVIVAMTKIRNQDITGTPWSDELALPIYPCSVRSRLSAKNFYFHSRQSRLPTMGFYLCSCQLKVASDGLLFSFP
jgi:hypothetical protein